MANRASTSTTHTNIGGNARIATLNSENQILIADIRVKAMKMMTEVAVDFEADNNFELVKELENNVLELLKASDECSHLSYAIESIKSGYQSGAELTNFSKLFDEKMEKSRKESSFVSENKTLLRKFHEAVWNVHHAGQPMPGDDQEDLVMTSTESSLLNTICPITGKAVTELAEPIRSMDCKHIYEKKAVMPQIMAKDKCPIAGCTKTLRADRVMCDPLLLVEIDEMRSMNKQRAGATFVEDFTDEV